MFDTSEIQQMNILQSVLNDNKFYKTLTFFVTSNSYSKNDKYHIFGNEETKVTFGMKPRKDLEVVSITLYKDCGELLYHKKGRSIHFDIPERQRDNLDLEGKIIYALDFWKCNQLN